jgi:hypothetical protein
MKTWIHLWQYPDSFFLEWELYQTEVVGIIKTHIFVQYIFPPKTVPSMRQHSGSGRRFLGPEPVLGVSRQEIQRRLGRWLIKQHWARWRGLSNTQRQVQELISEPSLSTKAKFLSFNRTQSRAVSGLLTGHNTLRWHLHLLGLAESAV